jgi:4-hydroxythreonine-4-phosphate dehydrogenase
VEDEREDDRPFGHREALRKRRAPRHEVEDRPEAIRGERFREDALREPRALEGGESTTPCLRASGRCSKLVAHGRILAGPGHREPWYNSSVIRIALSTGDPAGIGPEVALKAAQDERLSGVEVTLVGDPALLREAARRLGLREPSRVAPSLASPLAVLFSGSPSAESGRAAVSAVREAMKLVRGGTADALVTAPINKEALGLAGEKYPGHTELLAEELNAPRTRMMLAGGPLRVVLVTTHLALSDVPRTLTVEGVRDTILTAHEALRADFGIARPKIAVCALNPHASDGGRFGDEEARILRPALEAAKKLGAEATGPHPADTLFAKAARKTSGIDAVISMYHDQGLIPVKLAAFGAAVNVTLGIPIVRTSPDHGTAYDIAGKGEAEHDSIVHAVQVACEIVKARQARSTRDR